MRRPSPPPVYSLVLPHLLSRLPTLLSRLSTPRCAPPSRAPSLTGPCAAAATLASPLLSPTPSFSLCVCLAVGLPLSPNVCPSPQSTSEFPALSCSSPVPPSFITQNTRCPCCRCPPHTRGRPLLLSESCLMAPHQLLLGPLLRAEHVSACESSKNKCKHQYAGCQQASESRAVPRHSTSGSVG